MPWEKKEQIQRPVKQRKQVAPLNVVLGHVMWTVFRVKGSVWQVFIEFKNKKMNTLG